MGLNDMKEPDRKDYTSYKEILDGRIIPIMNYVSYSEDLEEYIKQLKSK